MARWRDRDYYYHEYYPKSTPREAKGGIKAQSKRGTFGETWWARRWIETLESFNIGARLGRGRSYARKGQVLSIEIEKGKVTSQVQGSRPKPYSITIGLPVMSGAEWEAVVGALSRQAIFAAKLLAGEMPQDIETAFNEVGLSLFPRKHTDLQTNCSCPDWSNPCKHIAAVYYLLGEEFDRDPFLIFKLRGMSRDDLIASLGHGGEQCSAEGGAAAPAERMNCAPEPLASSPSAFWGGKPLPENIAGEAKVPFIHAAMPKRLGNFPFWRGSQRFIDALEPIYAGASQCGMNAFLGEKSHQAGTGENGGLPVSR